MRRWSPKAGDNATPDRSRASTDWSAHERERGYPEVLGIYLPDRRNEEWCSVTASPEAFVCAFCERVLTSRNSRGLHEAQAHHDRYSDEHRVARALESSRTKATRYRREHGDLVRKRHRDYRATHLEEARRQYRDWAPNRKPERDQARARMAVWYALRTSALIQVPCVECGAKSEAHHHRGYDADHVLDVVWLCRPHHAAAHVTARALRRTGLRMRTAEDAAERLTLWGAA